MEIHLNKHNYQILTDDGYEPFDGVSCNGVKKIYKLLFENGSTIKCTEDHKLFVDLNTCRELKEINIGDEILTTNGLSKLVNKEECGEELVYDVLASGNNNRYYANTILVHNCEFIGKTGTLVDSDTMRNLLSGTKNITYEFVIDSDIRFYKQLDKSMKYLISIDPSMGVSGDFAAIQVFEFPTFIQVAEWMSDTLNQNDQVEKMRVLTEWMYADLKAKGCRTPEIYWSLENNSVGEGFICSLREKSKNQGSEKPQDYIRRAVHIAEIGNKRLGFTTTKRSKTMACAQLKNKLETGQMKIMSSEYAKQLSNFTLKEVNYSSVGKGIHDDLITASLTIMLMYLQCRNSLDLNVPIYTDTPIIDKDSRYEMPFLFVSR